MKLAVSIFVIITFIISFSQQCDEEPLEPTEPKEPSETTEPKKSTELEAPIDGSTTPLEYRSCEEWITIPHDGYPLNTIWEEAYDTYKVDHGDIDPKSFCKLFGAILPFTIFIIHEVTAITCREWIYVNGYYGSESTISRNIDIAIERSATKLDSYVSDWAQAYANHLLEPGVPKYTPNNFCAQYLQSFDKKYLSRTQEIIF